MKKLIIIFSMLFQMCSPAVVGLSTEGKIIASEKDRVFILFEEQMGDPGKFTGSWFYFPGLGIINDQDYYIEISLIRKDTGKAISGTVIQSHPKP